MGHAELRTAATVLIIVLMLSDEYLVTRDTGSGSFFCAIHGATCGFSETARTECASGWGLPAPPGLASRSDLITLPRPPDLSATVEVVIQAPSRPTQNSHGIVAPTFRPELARRRG
ncbi:MAG: hypothetical protein EA422_13055 [Gemmatimonadales bacterium]|nr:MAG: hypothetical protein EA422_13055 [Gemmatimonadales bacterium]